MELPCIVSNINGCNEIIENDINGIIIPPKNDMAILNAMIELKENRKKYDRMVKNSRPLIIERYQQEYIWNELLKNYQSL
jgi:glycosyltransferase involved in cell wall biosynthesis